MINESARFGAVRVRPGREVELRVLPGRGSLPGKGWEKWGRLDMGALNGWEARHSSAFQIDVPDPVAQGLLAHSQAACRRRLDLPTPQAARPPA
jgi:hypothetical protein